jgi:hypothetical protein
VNDDKREQACQRQRSDQLEKTPNYERTELRHAKNKKTVSDIQE